MTERGSLLHRLHAVIDRTYELGTADLDPARFVIGDAGLRALYSGRTARGRDLSAPDTAMLLIRSDEAAHGVRIYYPDRLIRNLELHPPVRGLDEDNLRDFATFVEELDHLLVVCASWRRGRPVTALELEMHANVTKVLVASHVLVRTLGIPRLDEERRRALRFELLERGDFTTEEPWLAERYRDARRHAARFLARLDRTTPPARPELLRRFSRAPLREKIALAA